MIAATKENMNSFNVFLIGNNPIELSNIYDKLKAIKNKTYNTEIAFEVKGLYKQIMKFSPSCILIDDNFDRKHLTLLMNRLAKNKITRNIPITIIKNTNKESHLSHAEDFVLKEGITSDLLSRSILNSIKIKRMQVGFSKLNKKKDQILAKWF